MAALVQRSVPRTHTRCVAVGSASKPHARSVAPRRAHGGARRLTRRAAGDKHRLGGPGDDVVKEARAPLSARPAAVTPHALAACFHAPAPFRHALARLA